MNIYSYRILLSEAFNHCDERGLTTYRGDIVEPRYASDVVVGHDGDERYLDIIVPEKGGWPRDQIVRNLRAANTDPKLIKLIGRSLKRLERID